MGCEALPYAGVHAWELSHSACVLASCHAGPQAQLLQPQFLELPNDKQLLADDQVKAASEVIGK